MVKVGIIGLGGMGNMHFGVHEAMTGAQVVALLLMLGPGFIVAIGAIRKASDAINALRGDGGIVGRGRAVFAILIAVATLVICVGTILVALDRAQHV